MAAKNFKRYEVGTEVAVEDGFTGEIHYGKVVSVKIEKNGYPTTMVDFPTKGGIREWNVDNLNTPEGLVQALKERKELFAKFGYR